MFLGYVVCLATYLCLDLVMGLAIFGPHCLILICSVLEEPPGLYICYINLSFWEEKKKKMKYC